ncbi:uncharacterized protein LOC120653792 [Panicum virgatum]|uniref:uncharacterized protein LOC120653792 n=1 Tax=Panicum virgatum TaxID=38727 RepID=UPI0019D53D1D|nr:uncharacterized protein LOC120653792 [Panicum virgatum]
MTRSMHRTTIAFYVIVKLTFQVTMIGAEEVLGPSATNTYKTLIVQRALSATVGEDDNRQLHNLFNMFLIVKDCRVHTIIDGGSCNNLVNAEVVEKLGLTTWAHPHPYHIQWFNNNGKVRSVLGLAGFCRRFVRDFSTIAAPLHKLTKNGVPFLWGPAQQQAFDALKTKLTQAPLLQLLDFEKTFEPECDASRHWYWRSAHSRR